MAQAAPFIQAADDPQLREAMPLEAISEAISAPGLQLPQIVGLVLEGYGDRPALGYRARELTSDAATGRRRLALLPAFETISYRQLWARSRAIASVWHHEGWLGPGDFVAILGFSSCDYVALDLACIYAGAVSVPLQTNASVAQLQAIVGEIEPRCIATSIDNLGTALEIVLDRAAPVRLIVMDYREDDDDQKDLVEAAQNRLDASKLPILLTTFDGVLAQGSAFGESPMAITEDGKNPLATLFYTSGSTGSPKGAMYPQNLLRNSWLATPPGPQIVLNYMPLNHQFGRAWVFMTLARGGTCYFVAKSDLSTWLDDVALVRPTNISLVPRICEMLYQQFQGEFDRRSAADDENGDDENGAVRQSVLQHMRTHVLGGRLAAAAIGSAPTAPELMAFMEDLLGFKMADTYGTTETGAITRNGQVLRPPVIAYKLIDVPELGYFTTDKPHPRGEIAVKSHNIIAGYFKRPELTASVIDDEGYYRTGDVMAEIGHDRLVYLDRRNNVLKLAQGEFVAIAHLEALFTSGHPLIRQIYLYGNSERSFLLAVIVPNREGGEPGGNLKSMLHAALQQVAAAETLNSYEIPRDFVIEDEPFSVENGLLAGVGKYLRPAFKARYGERLEELYAAIAAKQENDLRHLRSAGADAPVLETLGRAVEASLGLTQVDLTQAQTFGDLGGDSLSAVSFSLLLEEIFDLTVEVGAILNPAGSLQGLAAYIEGMRSGAEIARPSFATVHGRDASEVRAKDLTLEKFIDAETLARADNLPPASQDAPKTVLLTGANGFLGRFLCLEWLERLSAAGGKLVCIARGKDAADARRRIAAVFDSGDAVLKEKFEVLAVDHLDVLAGDIADPQLGLARADWDRLAAEVDLIVHPAALVNHMLPYSQLFGPNVAGTAELIRLAITDKMKRLINVSTVAAAIDADRNWIDEAADIRVASPVRHCDATYAGGYATSKWAGEVLLREAHDRFGLAISVFRSDMILAHSRYVGQINVPDMFTRWLFSLIVSGIAPRSFYEGDPARAHYDGLPVDFTAAAISDIGGAHRTGFATYHVLNPNDDGISLDSFVEWAIEAGYPIGRVADYADWRDRFEAALRALPENKRQASSLPLISQFAQPSRAQAGSPIPSAYFRAAVCDRGLGAEGGIPHLSAAFIRKCLGDLRAQGLIA